MLSFVTLFWNICLMREGPERLPGHGLLIALPIIGKIVLVLAINAARGRETDPLALAATVVVWAVVLGALAALALQLRERLPRFRPTYAALLGTDFFMHALYGTVILGIFLSGAELPSVVTETMNNLFQLWIIFIVGFIMHRALDLNFGLGILIAIFMTVFSVVIGSLAAQP